MRKAVGIDIGGTKIAVGVVTENGQLLKRVEVESDPTDREAMFQQVVNAVEAVFQQSSFSLEEIDGIGVGIPGKVDRTNGIAVFQNNLPWAGFPIVARLQEHFGKNRIVIDNDVYMAAFAEWKSAEASPSETFAYITVSTGISSSIIHRGSFFRGAGFAGELGLIPVASKRGSEELAKVMSGNELDGEQTLLRLEQAVAGPAIPKIAERKLNMEDLSAKDVFQGFLNGETKYELIIDEVVDYLTHGIYTLTCIVDPYKITLGGSVIVKNLFLLERIKAKLKAYQIEEQHHLLDNICISTLAQDNGVIGAGLRVFHEEF